MKILNGTFTYNKEGLDEVHVLPTSVSCIAVLKIPVSTKTCTTLMELNTDMRLEQYKEVYKNAGTHGIVSIRRTVWRLHSGLGECHLV